MAANNKKVADGSRVHLEMEVKTIDGELIGSTNEDGPFDAIIGSGALLAGIEKALLGLGIGDTFQVKLEPADAYGEFDDEAYDVVPEEAFDEEVEVGETYVFEDEDGETVQVTVSEINDEGVVIDFNHPLAGETLVYKGKIIEID